MGNHILASNTDINVRTQDLFIRHLNLMYTHPHDTGKRVSCKPLEKMNIAKKLKHLPNDILVDILDGIPLMKYFLGEFRVSSEQMQQILWTEIISLSLFRRADRDYLRALHLDSAHRNILHDITRFHIYHSANRRGCHWIGGLKARYTSLSEELQNMNLEVHPDGFVELYEHYNQLLFGEFEIISLTKEARFIDLQGY